MRRPGQCSTFQPKKARSRWAVERNECALALPPTIYSSTGACGGAGGVSALLFTCPAVISEHTAQQE